MSTAAILVIEDDPEIRELLEFSLAKEGWSISFACDGEEGQKILNGSKFDCIVLDIMLPGIDGIELLRRIKADPDLKRIPVIMTTAKGEDADVVSGLELGADDYVVKPYSPRVLAARIRAALRRRAEAADLRRRQDSILEIGPIRLDSGRHEVRVESQTVSLSATEFSILEFLMRNPGWVFSRSQIIDAIKGKDYPVTDRAVDVQILALRRKLGGAGDLIETVRGFGYRMKD